MIVSIYRPTRSPAFPHPSRFKSPSRTTSGSYRVVGQLDSSNRKFSCWRSASDNREDKIRLPKAHPACVIQNFSACGGPSPFSIAWRNHSRPRRYTQAAKVVQPGEGAFDDPTFAIAPQMATILCGRSGAAFAMGRYQQGPASQQPPAQPIAVVSPVGDDAQRPFLRSAGSLARHRDGVQGRFDQGHLRRTGRDQLVSERNTLAVDHHHPLRAFPPLGLADRVAPFLAGAKLPSTKLSLQSSCSRPSSSRKNSRQTCNQTSSSSQSRRRRQQVQAEGYFDGKSRHRAPVLSTHRMPSKTLRLSAQGRPPLRILGRSGSMRCHCESLRREAGIRSLPS